MSLAIAAGTGLAALAIALGGGPSRAVMIGAVTALMATLTVPPGTTRSRAAHVARVSLASGASAVLAAAIAPWPLAGDVVFVAVMGAAAWASRWGPFGTPIGMAAVMSHAIARLLRLDPATVAWAAVAACAGGLGATVVGLAFLPSERPAAALGRLLPAFAARLDRLVGALLCVIASGVEERGRDRVRDRLAAVQEVALQIDGALDPLARPSRGAELLREEVLRLEVLADHLAWSVNARAGVAPAPDEAVRLAACWRTGHATLRDPDRLLFLPEGAVPGTTERVLARMARGRRALDERAPRPEAVLAPSRVAQAPPSPPTPAGPAARKVVQACLAGAVAIALGRLLSPLYWEFAVMGAFFVIVVPPFRGAVVRRALDRTLGTALGVALGLGLGALIGGHSRVEVVILVALLFGAYWIFQVSYAWMMLLLTAVTALVYDLLGRFDASLLFVRLSETALGAAIGGIVAYFVLPSTSRAAIDGAVLAVLDALDDVLAALSGPSDAPALRDRVRRLDRAVAALRATTQPLVTTFPVPIRDEVRAARLLAATTRFRARALATALASPSGPPPLDEGVDGVLAAVRHRVQAVRAELDPARAAPRPTPGDLGDGEGPVADILRAIDARLVTWRALREAGRRR